MYRMSLRKSEGEQRCKRKREEVRKTGGGSLKERGRELERK